MLSSWGGNPSSQVDLVALAGGTAPKVDTAFEVGVMGGAKAVSLSVCVPALAPPAPQTLPPPSLDSEGPADYHVGLAFSQFFLNNALYEAHQSGTLCLSIDASQVPALSTALFKIPLPSLGVVSGNTTQDAPMMIVLRPLGNPVLHIGEGTFDPTTKKPIKPLLTIEVTDVRIDIYAMIEDRFVRLFTLGADIKVPVSLDIEGCPMTILPALGDLKEMIVIRSDVPTNAEILAEDPQALAQLIPMILGMAEPVLATAIKPISVGDISGFRLSVSEIKGIDRIGTTDDFNYLAAYATLGPAGQCGTTFGPRSHARLVEARIPSADQMQLRRDRPLPWPTAVLEVSADDAPGHSRPMEYAWRVDGGLWSTWFDGPRLTVEHPILIEPGHHRIEVRARLAGNPQAIGAASEPVPFVVDWEPPAVTLVPDEAKGLLAVQARDVVSPAETLRYAYRVGGGTLSSFGAARPIDLEAVKAAGSVEVQVMDEAGLVGRATWSAPLSAKMALAASGTGGAGDVPVPQHVGCSAGGAGLAPLAMLALIPVAMRRRRR
jgi:hypothetical protein